MTAATTIRECESSGLTTAVRRPLSIFSTSRVRRGLSELLHSSGDKSSAMTCAHMHVPSWMHAHAITNAHVHVNVAHARQCFTGVGQLCKRQSSYERTCRARGYVGRCAFLRRWRACICLSMCLCAMSTSPRIRAFICPYGCGCVLLRPLPYLPVRVPAVQRVPIYVSVPLSMCTRKRACVCACGEPALSLSWCPRF